MHAAPATDTYPGSQAARDVDRAWPDISDLFRLQGSLIQMAQEISLTCVSAMGVADAQRTVVTETYGPIAGRRVVRGHEGECTAHYRVLVEA